MIFNKIKGYNVAIFDSHVFRYPSPKSLSTAWSVGLLLIIYFAIQIITGIVLSCNYSAWATDSWRVVHVLVYKDLSWGWWALYLHRCGASFIFILLYVHLLRGLYFKSYDRITLWFSGLLLFLLTMAAAFTGYVLPWGTMSYWAATVITNFFSVIPVYGDGVVEWLWGGPYVGQPLLNRIYTVHFLLAFVLLGLIGGHIIILHVDNSSSLKSIPKQERVLWFDLFFLKDYHIYLMFFLFSTWCLGFFPDYFGHPDNWVEANPTKTPPHIVPEWYFLPFYGIVRSIPHKLSGIAVMVMYIGSFGLFPILDSTKSMRVISERPYFWALIIGIIVNFVILGYVGSSVFPAELAVKCVYAHGLFIFLMPVVTFIEREADTFNWADYLSGEQLDELCEYQDMYSDKY